MQEEGGNHGWTGCDNCSIVSVRFFRRTKLDEELDAELNAHLDWPSKKICGAGCQRMRHGARR